MTRRAGTLSAALASSVLALAAGPPPAFGASTVEVASASWPSASSGWVLGATACSTGTCTTVAHSTDAGTTWTAVAPPRAQLAPSGGNGVDEVHFADDTNGWAFYPQLHATHDGGRHWTRQPIPGGGTQVVSLTSGAGEAYAVVSSCVIGNPSSCPSPATVWRTTVGSDDWQQVPVSLPVQGLPRVEAAGRTAYVVLTGPTAIFEASTDSGATWSSRPSPCDAGAGEFLQVAPVNPRAVELLCSANVQPGTFTKRLFASTDTARTSILRGEAPQGGSPVDFAARGSVSLIAVAGGDSHILRSGDVGRTWTVPYMQESTSLTDLSLVGTTGSLVSGPAYFPGASGDLLLSQDSGRSWAVTPVTVD